MFLSLFLIFVNYRKSKREKMKIIFIDQVFSQIVYGQYEKDLSAMATKQKLQQLEDVFHAIKENNGGDEAQSILGYNEVKRALEQWVRR